MIRSRLPAGVFAIFRLLIIGILCTVAGSKQAKAFTEQVWFVIYPDRDVG